VEWSETDFSDINLGELTGDNKQAIGETALTLYTNGDVTITADNSNTAELSFDSHVLMTKYKLRYNGLGIKQIGDNSTVWHPFNTFLKKATDIVHTPTDGAVEVILSVKASVEEITPGIQANIPLFKHLRHVGSRSRASVKLNVQEANYLPSNTLSIVLPHSRPARMLRRACVANRHRKLHSQNQYRHHF